VILIEEDQRRTDFMEHHPLTVPVPDGISIATLRTV